MSSVEIIKSKDYSKDFFQELIGKGVDIVKLFSILPKDVNNINYLLAAMTYLPPGELINLFKDTVITDLNACRFLKNIKRLDLVNHKSYLENKKLVKDREMIMWLLYNKDLSDVNLDTVLFFREIDHEFDREYCRIYSK